VAARRAPAQTSRIGRRRDVASVPVRRGRAARQRQPALRRRDGGRLPLRDPHRRAPHGSPHLAQRGASRTRPLGLLPVFLPFAPRTDMIHASCCPHGSPNWIKGGRQRVAGGLRCAPGNRHHLPLRPQVGAPAARSFFCPSSCQFQPSDCVNFASSSNHFCQEQKPTS
jgi:hypothetical protein